MAWQDLFPLPGARIDAEEERELRLVAQARGGADWALSALVARYQPTVTRYLSRLTGSIERSRQLAERVFARMEQRIQGPQGGKQLRLWLLRTCTEMGLDTLREPRAHSLRALVGPRGPAGLLPSRAAGTGPLAPRAGGLAEVATKTSRQVRKLIWNSSDERADVKADRAFDGAAKPAEPTAGYGSDDPFPDLDPREALRFRMIRAVLAELPFGDAQCLALHLVAGLNQAEVARALGITGSATRKRVVHGLQLFAQRYEAAAASLRLPPETLRDREDREFKTPQLDHDFAQQPPRLSHRPASQEGDGALTTAPPDLVARVVPANPEEHVEDTVQDVFAETIESYDVANETTIAIYPLVVEADSTLPVPVPEQPDDAAEVIGPPLPAWDEAWAASDVLALPEPHIAIGSIPLSDMALALEMVDESLDPPIAGDAGVRDAAAPAASEHAVEEVMPLDAALEIAVAPSDASDAELGDRPESVLDDTTDDIALYDVAEMTRTPLAGLAVGAPPYDDAGALMPGTGADGGEDAGLGDAGDLVHIADLGEPLVVAISGVETPVHEAESGMPAQAEDAATPPVEAGRVAPPREPRRVPVLTASKPEEEITPEQTPARVVPVLSPEVSGADSAAGTVERARVAEPSLR
jgi:DNA-directed RNA polymerase specialized sigma24 family protein